ncbi:hypothetical protein GM661_00420 [Iocasia frigidifontis]|uniref:Uncharacterized protein n=1 Tax=Iocasia fonsfrigidae TaxID=2682810 RepID=A0A8A7KCC3_9FIRM|nr:hypothetical protein [Iocasia fonsfrigidae]QTL96537.1 hypothetical protein GM661_00420 [Iocasia fonsfrigidae]
MKHTPGPWIPGAASEKADIIIVAPNCTNLEDRYHPIAKVHRNHSDKHANAQLISAAPELLEALEELEKVCIYWLPDAVLSKEENLFLKIDDIINKAEGKGINER